MGYCAGRGAAAGATEDLRGRRRCRRPVAAWAWAPAPALLPEHAGRTAGRRRASTIGASIGSSRRSGRRPAAAASAEATLVGVVAAEEAGDQLVALVLVELVDVDATVEQVALPSAMTVFSRWTESMSSAWTFSCRVPNRVWHQGLDGLAHLTPVGAELAGDIRHRDLVERSSRPAMFGYPSQSSCHETSAPTLVSRDDDATGFTLRAFISSRAVSSEIPARGKRTSNASPIAAAGSEHTVELGEFVPVNASASPHSPASPR